MQSLQHVCWPWERRMVHYICHWWLRLGQFSQNIPCAIFSTVDYFYLSERMFIFQFSFFRFSRFRPSSQFCVCGFYFFPFRRSVLSFSITLAKFLWTRQWRMSPLPITIWRWKSLFLRRMRGSARSSPSPPFWKEDIIWRRRFARKMGRSDIRSTLRFV